jgi:hypothetical protein
MKNVAALSAYLFLAAPGIGAASEGSDLLRRLEAVAAEGSVRPDRPEERAATRARLDAVTGEPGDVLRALEAEAEAMQRDRPEEWVAAEMRLNAALEQPPFWLPRRPGTTPPDPSVGQENWPLPLLTTRAIDARTARLRRAFLRGIAANPDPRRLSLMEALGQGMPPDALDDALPRSHLWDELMLASATLSSTEARLPGLLAAEGPPRFDDLGLGLVLRFAPELRPETRRLAFDRLLVRRSDPESMWRLQVEDRYWKALLLLDRVRASDVMAADLVPGSRQAFVILGVLETEPGVGERLVRALRGLGGRLVGRDRDLAGPRAQVALLRMAPRENLPAALEEAMVMAARARQDETGDAAIAGAIRIIDAGLKIDAMATAARVAAPLLGRRDIDAPFGLQLLDGLEAGRDPRLAQFIREWRSAGPRRAAMLAERARVWGPYGKRALREAGR